MKLIQQQKNACAADGSFAMLSPLEDIRVMAFCKRWGVLALLGLLLGCSSGSLDKKTAAKEIELRFNGDVNAIVVQVGRVGSHCAVLDSDGSQLDLDLSPEKNMPMMVAIKAGYLVATPDGGEFWKVSLTERGKAAPNADRPRQADYHNVLKGCDYRIASFAVATPELVKITGISGDADLRTVDVEWKWTATELGVALRETGDIYSKLTPQQKKEVAIVVLGRRHVPIPVPQEGQINRDTAEFKKYDDGWRPH